MEMKNILTGNRLTDLEESYEMLDPTKKTDMGAFDVFMSWGEYLTKKDIPFVILETETNYHLHVQGVKIPVSGHGNYPDVPGRLKIE